METYLLENEIITVSSDNLFRHRSVSIEGLKKRWWNDVFFINYGFSHNLDDLYLIEKHMMKVLLFEKHLRKFRENGKKDEKIFH